MGQTINVLREKHTLKDQFRYLSKSTQKGK